MSGLLTPDDESDDYFISGFNVDPEQLDVGAILEEFEHQFGLPDLYTTDLENSNAWRGAHSAGVWGGPLGGARPVGHNLWQDWVLGWRHPIVIDYDDPRLLAGRSSIDIGRARNTPEGVEDGVIVRLPDSEEPVPNLAGSGTGWYSSSGDLLDNRVSRTFDLSDVSAESAPITFSFASAWDIEADWDYGLIEFSSDGGATRFTRPDEDGILTDLDPNQVGVVAPGESWGLPGEGAGRLAFDLSAYAGSTLGVRLRYPKVRVRSGTSSVVRDGGAVSLTLVENIGGKLVQPTVVLELPPGVEYVPGSATGGLEPVDADLASSQAVADSLRSGVPTRREGSAVRYLVWRGDTIPTAGNVPPFGFRYRARPGTTGSIEAEFFKNANERFQTERISLGRLN